MKPIATVQLPIARFVLVVLEKKDDHELATWIRAFTRSLAKCDPSLDDFAAELLNDVNEYRKEDARKKREKRKSLPTPSGYEEERLDEDPTVARTVECKKRQSGDTTKAPPTYSALPYIPTPDEAYDYASEHGLNDMLAREWYEMTADRQWSTRDGEIIKNWKSALKAYVKTRTKNLTGEKNERK